MTGTDPARLRHGKVDLALHPLRGGEGRALLLLHGLGERSPAVVPSAAQAWPGPVWGLDFSGHGDSSVPAGGGYTAEVLMGDADAALAHLVGRHAEHELGTVTVLGRGLGAYVALLLAGARPADVRGTVLADGPGLQGGSPVPTSPLVLTSPDGSGPTPDPWALLELGRDVRPPDYASSFARTAVAMSTLETPLTVAAVVRPPWLEAVVAEVGVQEATVAEGLALYSSS